MCAACLRHVKLSFSPYLTSILYKDILDVIMLCGFLLDFALNSLYLLSNIQFHISVLLSQPLDKVFALHFVLPRVKIYGVEAA